MSKVYSTYEAKAKFSEILRQVREGRTITISYHGEPVAEIRPIEKKRTLDERWKELEERGVLIPPRDPAARIRPIAHLPGALERFLKERRGE
jgi:prevent-host-death family protein